MVKVIEYVAFQSNTKNAINKRDYSQLHPRSNDIISILDWSFLTGR